MYSRTDVDLAYQMLRIRLFEERALTEFSKGKLFGTTHTCIGQEADAVGVIGAMRRSDVVVSNHRGHGHYLAHGGDMRALAAELMGRATGVCGGVGGSQHLYFSNFYSNGVQGGMLPTAAGVALSEKRSGRDSVVAVFLGDGTLGEGTVYEAINITSLWKLPVLFVVEDNGYAQSTPTALNLSGRIAARFDAFDVPVDELESTDVRAIRTLAQESIDTIRRQCAPRALVLHTYRLAPHSKGDDHRDPAEIERRRDLDPIRVLWETLSEAAWQSAYSRAQIEVEQAYKQAESDPWPVAAAPRSPFRKRLVPSAEAMHS